MADNKSEQSKADPKAEESVKQKGLSKEAWAAVSAIAVALIGGAVAIMTAIIPKLPIAKPSSSPIPVSPAVDLQVVTADAIANHWTGQAKSSSGELYTITVEIRQACKVSERCGTISVLPVPCYGEISLKAVQSDDYEFDVSNFDRRSSPNCTPGAGEHFKLLPNGKLSYKADWDAQGILGKAQ
ncbi:MAG: hypothetical protein LH660_07345 [Phormidesmis sp. CAN_BIN36]|nr:hypothetical protein [Phormidesmis sp. CAN_BIN36]